MNAMETRKLAQELGIKNAAKFKKDVLERMIAEVQAAKRNAELAVSKTKPAAKKASKRCTICATRPAGGKEAKAEGFSDYCDPCWNEANWENTHSDHGHDDAGCVAMGWDSQESLDACWICHPELNKASKEYVAKGAGTSREGMRMTVPVRGAAQEKVAAVIAQLPEGTEHSTVTDEFKMVHLTILAGPVRITLAWHADGAYAYDATSAQRDANSRVVKVRNASAALRLLGV